MVIEKLYTRSTHTIRHARSHHIHHAPHTSTHTYVHRQAHFCFFLCHLFLINQLRQPVRNMQERRLYSPKRSQTKNSASRFLGDGQKGEKSLTLVLYVHVLTASCKMFRGVGAASLRYPGLKIETHPPFNVAETLQCCPVR